MSSAFVGLSFGFSLLIIMEVMGGGGQAVEACSVFPDKRRVPFLARCVSTKSVQPMSNDAIKHSLTFFDSSPSLP